MELNDIIEYCRNKNVLIIGNAVTELTNDDLEPYDVVVRINYYEGPTRCDIWYVNSPNIIYRKKAKKWAAEDGLPDGMPKAKFIMYSINGEKPYRRGCAWPLASRSKPSLPNADHLTIGLCPHASISSWRYLITCLLPW